MGKKILVVFLLLIFLLLFGFVRNLLKVSTNIKPMISVQSPVFKNGELIPLEYTCDGNGINPPILINNVPQSAKSLVLIVDDPDAPAATFTHWVIWNIDPLTKEIKEDETPIGAMVGVNSAGKNQYTPPCPPSGTHRYFFKVYALDIVLNLPPTTKSDELSLIIKNHILDEGVLMGKYSR